MKPLHITALQLDLIWENPEANRSQIEHLLMQENRETDLIVLPEMFTTGFTMKASANYEEMEGETEQWMKRLSRKYDALVGGSIIVKEGTDYYNRFLVVGPEGVIAEYDKRHLFRMSGEHEYYEQGEDWVWFEYKGWKIVPLICYDLRFPVWSRNRIRGDGSLACDLLLYVANWPQKRSHHWETLLRARAIENQCYVVGVNRVGTDGLQIPYTGNSMILDYMGEDLAYNVGDETVLQAELDPGPLNKWRSKFPIWKDADVFELYP
ncbi:MAG: amidohydrolase [Bacteroidota bacterium]